MWRELKAAVVFVTIIYLVSPFEEFLNAPLVKAVRLFA